MLHVMYVHVKYVDVTVFYVKHSNYAKFKDLMCVNRLEPAVCSNPTEIIIVMFMELITNKVLQLAA